MLDAAVLCALPLDRKAWLGRAHSTPCGDFARSFAAARFDGNHEKAWSFFKDEARFVDSELALFASWGVLVCRQASSNDLKQASSLRKDIAVIAHWKGEAGLQRAVPQDRQGHGPGHSKRVELWDAMLSRDEFASLLHRERLRTLYLAICSSDYLLEATRRSNPDAICLGSRDTVRAGISMMKLAAALNLCRLDSKPLWRCLATAGEMFDQMGNA